MSWASVPPHHIMAVMSRSSTGLDLSVILLHQSVSGGIKNSYFFEYLHLSIIIAHVSFGTYLKRKVDKG